MSSGTTLEPPTTNLQLPALRTTGLLWSSSQLLICNLLEAAVPVQAASPSWASGADRREILGFGVPGRSFYQVSTLLFNALSGRPAYDCQCGTERPAALIPRLQGPDRTQ